MDLSMEHYEKGLRVILRRLVASAAEARRENDYRRETALLRAAADVRCVLTGGNVDRNPESF
jgi:hypothetical protein